MENADYYTASSMALRAAGVRELYPFVYYTNKYGICDAQTVRVANIKLVIVIDRILFDKRESFKDYLDCTHSNHKRIRGVNDCSSPYRYGSDVETVDITFGGPGEKLDHLIPTCYKVVYLLMQATSSGQRALVIDYNISVQRAVVIGAALLIFQKSKRFYPAALEVLRKDGNKVYLGGYYLNLLYEFETFVNIKKYNDLYIREANPPGDTWKAKIFDSGNFVSYKENEAKEKVRMIQHLNDGKAMEDFTFLSDLKEKEKDDSLNLDTFLDGDTGPWNDASASKYFPC